MIGSDQRLTNPYSESGIWLRGNIHTHTTASDGEHEPQAVVDWYAEHRYDFLCITDHNFRLDPRSVAARGMVLAAGEELTDASHVLALDIEQTLPFGGTTQDRIDTVVAAGGLSIVCHPHWMGLTVDDLIPLQGHLGIEIYNQVCVRLNNRGDSVAWWDALLARGIRTWGFAVDDMHRISSDAGGGWIVVHAEERSWVAISRALQRGSFYATTGPAFRRIDVQDRRVTVQPDEKAAVKFIGSGGRILLEQAGANSASMELPSDEPFVRVELAVEGGRRAWTQPFWAHPG